MRHTPQQSPAAVGGRFFIAPYAVMPGQPKPLQI